jgi:hypothetical protein
MRISGKAQELARMKYIRRAQEISKTHWTNIKRFEQTMGRGGARSGAIDNEHVTMRRELGELYGQVQLESFVAEEMLPSRADMAEIKAEMERIVNHRQDGSSWNPGPATNASLTHLAQSVFIGLANQIRQMELEKTFTKPASESYSLTIQGDVIGGIQQGTGNTQNIQTGQSVEALTNKLIEVIQKSSMVPLEKMQVIVEVYQIQHLETLDQSTTVIQEKRERLLTVDKLLSTTADVYTLAVPTIIALRAMFGA